jgi:hypothetical protein
LVGPPPAPILRVVTAATVGTDPPGPVPNGERIAVLDAAEQLADRR